MAGRKQNSIVPMISRQYPSRCRAALSFLIILYTGTLHSVQASCFTCSRISMPFLHDLQSQCHPAIQPNTVEEVDGKFVERYLTSKPHGYVSILFYSSHCPFSCSMHSKFQMLASMFPEIQHIALEKYVALPSVFSSYRIHSVPSLLLINQTARLRFHGRKDLQSLTNFYKRATGYEPLHYPTKEEEDLQPQSENCEKQETRAHPWSKSSSSFREMWKSEPYLVLSMLFLCLRTVLLVSPKLFSQLRVLFVPFVPNLLVFGDTNQLFARAANMISLRRIWAQLRLCKTRNFHERAKNCRVLASSLASVSNLGESSARTHS